MDQSKSVSKIETIPDEIFRVIFKHLAVEDVFNLGETSKRLSFIVVNNVTHPLGTKLQYLKTVKKHFEKLPSSYDGITQFPYSNLCSKEDCDCQLYQKRKDIILIHHVYCSMCTLEPRMTICTEEHICRAVMRLKWCH